MIRQKSARLADDLCHYQYADLYDKTFSSRRLDIEYFCDLARATPACPILEYGAGSGRVTIPLAEQGHAVTAVDKSSEMLSLLKARRGDLPREVGDRIVARQGDMRRLSLRQKFPLVLATFNVVAHLPSFLDMAAFLKKVKEHLAPGGRFVFDVSLPHSDELEADPDEAVFVGRFKHPLTGEWISQTERFEYDVESQILLVESSYRCQGSKDELSVPLYLRQWFPKETEAILQYEGFRILETHADYTTAPGMLAEDTIVYLTQC
jgi:SAM-dependent methyltransferase